MRILLTGFDPFGTEKINPSSEILKRMPDEIRGIEVVKMVLPTVFYDSIEILEKALKDYEPTLVICLGQAGGRQGMSIERVAINIDDARIADNKNQQPIDEIIKPDGEAAYFTTLPIKSMVAAVKNAGYDASVSNSAGTFVCNHVMYALLHAIKSTPTVRGGFVHVPYAKEQCKDKQDLPHMTIDDMVQALIIMIETALTCQEDMKYVGGTIC